MAFKYRQRDSAAIRIGKSTFQLLLMDLPIIGWFFVFFFAWQYYRQEKRSKVLEQGK